MRKLFSEAGMPRRMPPHMPDCAAQEEEGSPRIASPLLGTAYPLRTSRSDATISLEASVAANVQHLFWFDGGALIGKVEVGAGGARMAPGSGFFTSDKSD
jgi:penicillin-binding protein 1C